MSTGNLNSNSQSAKKNIRFEHDLIEAIENHKDELIPFAAWVKQACREKLERETQVRPKVSNNAHDSDSAPMSANEKRKVETITSLKAICNAMTPDQKEEVLNARYQKSTFAKVGSIYFKEPSKDSVAKYWEEIILPELKAR
jgi:wyosine [tRNA(Phe)-imidazoG37] synthetase (radical SAM superfamily)